MDVRRIRIRLRTLGLPLRGMRIRVLRRQPALAVRRTAGHRTVGPAGRGSVEDHRGTVGGMPVMPLRPEGREKRRRGIPPMPGMPQNRTRRQPHRDQGQVEPLVPSAEGDEAQSQTTGRAVGTNHRKGRGVMDANSIIWVCAIICVVSFFPPLAVF
ncbi:hypothetical protein [Enterococcus sp. RTP21361st1_A6_RTP21361_211029]|uniref:hypothetical protein n=1 Tax=Enterococcus sp. RTP21361st1_A6_RTP21361_211029 TaxID=3143199 RepID=UPI0034A576E3